MFRVGDTFFDILTPPLTYPLFIAFLLTNFVYFLKFEVLSMEFLEKLLKISTRFSKCFSFIRKLKKSHNFVRMGLRKTNKWSNF